LIGPDGFPFVSFNQIANVKLVHCTSSDCSSADPPVILGPITSLPYSLAIGTDGFPVVAYTDGTDVKFIHCTDVSCNTFDAPVTLESTNNANYPSIAIGGDGFPVVLYEGLTTFFPNPGITLARYSIVHCTNPTCSSFEAPVLGAYMINGKGLALAIGDDGFPSITYMDVVTVPQTFNVAHCGTANCSSYLGVTTIKEVDFQNLDQVSIAVIFGSPLILYFDSTNSGFETFELAKCIDAACQSISALNPIQVLPKMAAGDTIGTVLCHGDKVSRCADPTCSVILTEATIPLSGAICASIAIGDDGCPVLVVNHSGALKLIDCVDPGCLN